MTKVISLVIQKKKKALQKELPISVKEGLDKQLNLSKDN
jgi:hypothetical protein